MRDFFIHADRTIIFGLVCTDREDFFELRIAYTSCTKGYSSL